MYVVTVHDGPVTDGGNHVGTVVFNDHTQAQHFCAKVKVASNWEADPVLTLVLADPADILAYWED